MLRNMRNKDYSGSNYIPVQCFRRKCKTASGLTRLASSWFVKKKFFSKTRPDSWVNGKFVFLSLALKPRGSVKYILVLAHSSVRFKAMSVTK